MKKNCIVLILILLAIVDIASAQIKTIGTPYIKRYSQNDYIVSNQNFDVLQDNRGVMYFANGSGILEFDGVCWNIIKTPSNTAVFSLDYNDSENVIYVGANGDFGYLKADSSGIMKFNSLLEKVPEQSRVFQQVYSTLITENEGIIFQSKSTIFIYKEDTIIVKKAEHGFQGVFNVGNKVLAASTGHGIIELKNGVFSKIDELSPAGDDIKYIEQIQDSLIIINNSDGVFSYKNNECHKIDIPLNTLIKKDLYCVSRLHDGSYAFGTQSKGIIITDSKFNVIKTGLLDTHFITSFYEDENHVLWATLYRSGLVLIDLFSPFSKFYNRETNISGTVNSVFQKGQDLYLGTDAIYYVNIDSLKNPKFQLLKNPKGRASIYRIDTINGQIIGGFTKGLFTLNGKTLSNVDEKDQNARIFHISKTNPNIMLVGAAQGFSVYELKNGKWKYSNGLNGFDEQVRHFVEDDNGNFWISVKNKGVFKIRINETFTEVTSISKYNSENGLPSDFENYVFSIRHKVVVATIHGFYKYDQDSDKFFENVDINKAFGNNNAYDFMYHDRRGNIWVKQVIAGKKDENERTWILQRYRLTSDTTAECFYKPFLPYMNHIYSFGYIGRNCYVIGDQDGFVHYDANIQKDFSHKYSAHITNIESIYNDSVIVGGNYSGSTIVLPYSMHGIRISFSAMYYEYPEMMKFKTFLENNDDNWSDFRNETQKEYSNLSPGTYTFHVIAKNGYDQESEETTITFRILAPWYLNRGMIVVYLLFLAGLIWLIVKAYTMKLIRDKQKLEQIVDERTAEIRAQSKLIIQKNAELDEKNKNITDSIKYAQQIQEAMLPLKEKINKALPDNFILFRPKDIVSGDYYWFAETDRHIIITAADCTGHGVPGAFMSMIGSQILTEIVTEGITAADEILTNQNNRIRKALKQDTTENHDGMDMALCSIDKQTKIVEFAGAKNPLIYVQNEVIDTIKADKQGIGGDQIEENFVFTKHEIQADGNTWFYMFSDGFQDQFGGPKQKKFMIKRLRELLFEIHNEKPEKQREILNNAIEDWIGPDGEQTDDVILIGFKL